MNAYKYGNCFFLPRIQRQKRYQLKAWIWKEPSRRDTTKHSRPIPAALSCRDTTSGEKQGTPWSFRVQHSKIRYRHISIKQDKYLG